MSREMDFNLGESWQTVLKEELEKPYISDLKSFLNQERVSGMSIFPPQHLIFNAFLSTPYDEVKVILVGQDPYHGAGQAHGLCFSVPHGVKQPPSLKNIIKELALDLGLCSTRNGCLQSWAKQGVLLLNATLTVREGAPLSHHKKGWEIFTDAVIAKIAAREKPVVFILWGNSAQKKFQHVVKGQINHLILTAPHPSPLSAYQGFLGCKHFSMTNEWLIKQGKTPIDWTI